MFAFSDTAIEADALKSQVADHSAGACATFEGWVRDHNEGKAVRKLAYEAYAELAEKEGTRILEEARTRFGLLHAVCVHRIGELALGDMAVWVGVSAPHRGEAFDACRYIIDEVKHRVPIWKKEFYVDGDSGWVNCERCAQHSHDHDEPALAVTAEEMYARQSILQRVGVDGQQKLNESRVLIVGMGGLGCPAAQYLAGAGVGTLGLCESDRVETTNLHRQPLYGIDDVGKPKVRIAAQRIGAQNPLVKVVCHEERLTTANAQELFGAYDLVLDCTDNFDTKYLINDAAVLLRKPVVFASIYQFEGHVFTFRPDRGGPCMRCIWPDAPAAGCIGNCAEAGVLGVVPGLAGTWQAMEAVKLLLGWPEALNGEVLLCDFLGATQERLRIARDPLCPGCGEGAAPDLRPEAYGEESDLEVEPDAVLVSGAGYLVVDIRETEEIRQAPLHVLEAQSVPGSTWDLDAPPLDRDRDVVLCCARGVRSKGLARALRERGYRRVYSLRGGAAALR